MPVLDPGIAARNLLEPGMTSAHSGLWAVGARDRRCGCDEQSLGGEHGVRTTGVPVDHETPGATWSLVTGTFTLRLKTTSWM